VAHTRKRRVKRRVRVKRRSKRRVSVARKRSRRRSSVSGGFRRTKSGIGRIFKSGIVGKAVTGIGAGTVATIVLDRIAPQFSPMGNLVAGFLGGGLIGGGINALLNGGLGILNIGGFGAGGGTNQGGETL